MQKRPTLWVLILFLGSEAGHLEFELSEVTQRGGVQGGVRDRLRLPLSFPSALEHVRPVLDRVPINGVPSQGHTTRWFIR